MAGTDCKFYVGQLIKHNKFDYRGVIVDVDSNYSGTDQWYEQVAKSKPPKDQPWYHVLVHNSTSATYVAERHLQAEGSIEPIEHPLVKDYFTSFIDGKYLMTFS